MIFAAKKIYLLTIKNVLLDIKVFKNNIKEISCKIFFTGNRFYTFIFIFFRL